MIKQCAGKPIAAQWLGHRVERDAGVVVQLVINAMGDEMNVAGLGRMIGEELSEGEIGPVHSAGADKVACNDDDRAWLVCHRQAGG